MPAFGGAGGGLPAKKADDNGGGGEGQTAPENAPVKPDFIGEFAHCSREIIPGLVGAGPDTVQLRAKLVELDLLVLGHGWTDLQAGD